MNIKLRPATIEDLNLLKYWDQKSHVLFATGNDEYEEDDWMENQLKNPSKYVWVYIAELESRPIGVVQIVDPANEETHYWGKMDEGLRAIDIWVGEEDDLGKGYGTIMMRLALEKCFAYKDVKRVLVDPIEENVKAINFYKKMGFEFLENRAFEDDDCVIYKIDKEKFISDNN